uniref:Ig-like domain-containing protein n=1 Tax=Neogobius melanostomus TaxID=47308 RepID=A0A8C6WVX6_9GOBI
KSSIWVGRLLFFPVVSLAKGHEQIPLTMVKPGDNFTMICSVNRTEAGLIYWYRMSFEPVIETIAEGSYEKISLLQKHRDHRFSVTKVEKNLYSFHIFNVTKEDEASYFCQAGSSYKMAFFNATFLMVIGKTFYLFSSAPLGGSVELECSLLSKRNSSVPCPSKRSVHWFRAGSGKSPASTIYTYKDQTEEQDQRKCVYRLTTTLQHLNDTGTYYCAVATCGEILFGNGTRVEISSSKKNTML